MRPDCLRVLTCEQKRRAVTHNPREAALPTSRSARLFVELTLRNLLMLLMHGCCRRRIQGCFTKPNPTERRTFFPLWLEHSRHCWRGWARFIKLFVVGLFYVCHRSTIALLADNKSWGLSCNFTCVTSWEWANQDARNQCERLFCIQWNLGFTSKSGLKNLDVELRWTYKWK